jgi:hypothetical protein
MADDAARPDSGDSYDIRYDDKPRAITALFDTEEQGRAALVKLHEAGFTKAWLGVTRAQTDEGAFSVVVREQGGDRYEQATRGFWREDTTLYDVMTDHGVADDVARRLNRKMPQEAVVVIAGWLGDIREAARILEECGGRLERGADGGVIGTARPRQPEGGS